MKIIKIIIIYIIFIGTGITVISAASNNIGSDDIEINVKDYGVKGDGITDNTIAINQLLKKHRKLYFPKGVYIFKYLKIDSSINNIRGDGMGVTVLKSSGKTNDHTLIINSETTLSKLTVNGSGDQMPKPLRGDGASCLVISGKSNKVNIYKVEFINSYNKQVIVLAGSVTLNGCVFRGAMDLKRNIDGVHIYGGVNKVDGVMIDSCKFYNNIRAGVYTDIDVKNVTISNSYFYNLGSNYQGGTAIILQGGANNIKISKNTVVGYKRGVIIRNGASDIYITDNIFNKIYSNGIFISTSGSLDAILKKENNFVQYRKAISNINNGKFNYSFDNIQITNNKIAFTGYNGRILEPTTSSFILVGGDNKNEVKTKFSNVKISGCQVTSDIDGIKSFIFFIIPPSDIMDNVSILNCSKPNNLKMLGWYGDSKNRVKFLPSIN